ncbi:Ig-like domain-containing protein [Methanobacterium sp. SMA-27]|uniref:Ig-like domain-containing protein n=1 Tax=Methanobacterium sp. SMA-27 TaxID=1495336 RepID=UPI00064F7E80|nr:Ig-like domain-containing protein [Methanobacterium sp. SMA-27]
MKTMINRKLIVYIPLLLIGLGIIFSAGMQSVAADQSQIYVNSSGNDNYNGESPVFISGTIGPKKTIKNATKTVINDGTVHIAAGTYNENNIADFSKNINFIGEDKYKTKVDGNKLGGIFSVGAQGATYSYSFTNLQFLNGSAFNGGAISNTCGNILIDNCIFKNNKANYAGAAIFSFGTGSAPASININNCNFTNNSAPNGVIYNGLSSVSVIGSDFTNNTGSTTSILWSNFGQISNFQFNRIIGTGNLISSDSGGDVSLNWWGSNADPSAKLTGVTATNWLVLTAFANPSLIVNGATSIVTADLLHDNGILTDPTNPDLYYHDPLFGHVPDGIIVNFLNDAFGTVNPLTSSLINGSASTTFTGTKIGTSVVQSTIDSVTTTSNVIISSALVVTSTDPVKNAGSVALNKVVKITFNKNIKLGTNPWIEFKTAAGTAITFTTKIVNNVLSLTPTSLLKGGTTYNVVLHSNSITDLSGLGLAAPYSTVFTTTVPPVVTSTDPVNNISKVATNKIVKFNFSKNIKLGTNPWIEFKNSSGTAKPFTLSVSGSTLSIKPTSALSKSTNYTVIVHSNAVIDSNGTGLAAPYTIKFKTA